MTDDTQKQLSIGGENVTHPQPENCAPPIVGDRQTEIQGDGPRASKSADHGPQDDTQKRIDWIKETRRTILEGGTVAMFEAQAMVENDIPWLLEQLDEANKFRWFAQYWATRVERILTEKGLLVEVLSDIGPCTPADAPKGYVRAEHLYRALSKRDAEIARLRVEVERLRQGLEYIQLRGYTGAAFVAGEVLGGRGEYNRENGWTDR